MFPLTFRETMKTAGGEVVRRAVVGQVGAAHDRNPGKVALQPLADLPADPGQFLELIRCVEPVYRLMRQ